jgi:hypothetical protein
MGLKPVVSLVSVQFMMALMIELFVVPMMAKMALGGLDFLDGLDDCSVCGVHEGLDEFLLKRVVEP